MQGKNFILSLLLLFVCSFTFGQSEFGMKLGMQSYSIDKLERLSVESVGEAVDLAIQDVDLGFHAGFYGRIKIAALYIEPALLLNSHSATYQIQSDSSGTNVNSVHKEYYQNLDIPITLGIKFGPVKIHAGPVAHIHLKSTSELFDVKDYEQRFSDASFGYQAGLALDIKKLRIEANYEGNFSKFGDHMVFAGQEIQFSQSPSRLIFSVGIAF